MLTKGNVNFVHSVWGFLEKTICPTYSFEEIESSMSKHLPRTPPFALQIQKNEKEIENIMNVTKM